MTALAISDGPETAGGTEPGSAPGAVPGPADGSGTTAESAGAAGVSAPTSGAAAPWCQRASNDARSSGKPRIAKRPGTEGSKLTAAAGIAPGTDAPGVFPPTR